MIDETICSFAKKIVEITKTNHEGMQITMIRHIRKWYGVGILPDIKMVYPEEEILQKERKVN